MAVNESTIKTIFAIDGDTQYKDAIESINKEQTLLRSEMSKINAEYKLNGDKVQYNQGKVENLNKQLDLQKRRVDEAKHAVEQSTLRYGEGSEEANMYTGQLNRAEAQLIRLEKQLQEATREMKLSEDAAYQAGIRMQETGKKWQESGDKMAGVGKSLTKGVSVPIAAIGALASKAAIDFETGMAGVRKTTDLTADELDEMSQALRNMALEIPISVNELTTLTTTAGQLGIEKENLLGFTRVMADLGVASNIAGEEGATAMAQFANITKMSQKDFDRMGSSIVELGNNTATTEKDILNMAQRLAAAGSQANMSEADILGISAGLASLGLEAQAGGSAFSKVINEIQLEVDTGGEKLGDFAAVAGMSADQFSTAWGENAADALATFIVGLGDTEKHGKSTNEILDELGITELRMGDALRRTSGANELFTETLDMSNRAWEENNALTEEATILYGTTESQLTIAKNKINDAAIEMGDNLIPIIADAAEWVGDLVTKFTDLPDKTQLAILKMGGFAAALGPVLTVGGNVQKVFGHISSGIGGIVTAAREASIDGGGISQFIGSLSSGAKAGMVGAAAAAVGGLVLLVKKITEIPEEVKNVTKAFADAQAEAEEIFAGTSAQIGQIEQYQATIRDLTDVENKNEAQKLLLKDAVEKLNALIPDLNLAYDEQNDLLSMNADEIDNVINAEKRRIVEAAKNKILEEQLAAQTDALVEINKKTAELKMLEKSRAEIEQLNNRLRLSGLSDEEIRMAQLSDAHRESLDLTQEQKDLLDELAEVLEREGYAVENFTDASTEGWTTSTNAVDGLDRAIDKASGTLGLMQEEFDKGTIGQDEYNKILDESTEKLIGLGDESEDLAETVEDSEDRKAKATEEGSKAQEDAIDGVSEAYKTEQEEIKNYLAEIERLTDENISSMSGFAKERLDLSETTTEEFMAHLREEMAAFTNYHTNLQTIASKVGPDVAAELEKLGPAAAPLIEEFANGSDEQLRELAAIYGTRQEQANRAALAEMGVLPGEVTGIMALVKGAVSDSGLWSEGYLQGGNLAKGLSKGILDNQWIAIQSSGGMAQKVIYSSGRTLEVKSPSEAFKRQGKALPQGLAIGIEKDTDLAVAAIEKMGKEVSGVGIDAIAMDYTLPSLTRIADSTGGVIPISSSASTVSSSTDNRLTVNVTVPPGETEDFGRRVGRAIADELQISAISRGA